MQGDRFLSWRRVALVLAGAALAWSLASAQDQRKSEAALKTVRKEIKDLETRLTRDSARRDEGAKALRAAEVESAAATRKLADVRAKLAEQRAARRALGDQTDRANQRLAAERAALGAQARMSYITGRAEVFKLLLSQESPATLGRMLVYYDYLNRARSARIAAVGIDLDRLAALNADTGRVEAELKDLEGAQATQVAALAKARDERGAVVTRLDSSIKDDSAAVAKLHGEEKRLSDLVEQLRQLMAGLPVEGDQPFAKLKGKLAWPVQGRLAGDFGQPRAGSVVKWNGVLLEAAAGVPVRAVYHGRVAFADWLPGLGLLLIIDHGGGYMSLYGHNEALLKESGDWVQPGETIAQVGDTGGAPRPALYFEIRFKGEPVNPHTWITRPTSR
ncbi:MAG: peptidoglycan DD-metalloendopeptidase family protein [Gammaproteobacteria bacterium]